MLRTHKRRTGIHVGSKKSKRNRLRARPALCWPINRAPVIRISFIRKNAAEKVAWTRTSYRIPRSKASHGAQALFCFPSRFYRSPSSFSCRFSSRLWPRRLRAPNYLHHPYHAPQLRLLMRSGHTLVAANHLRRLMPRPVRYPRLRLAGGQS